MIRILAIKVVPDLPLKTRQSLLKKGTDRSVHSAGCIANGNSCASGTEWSVPFLNKLLYCMGGMLTSSTHLHLLSYRQFNGNLCTPFCPFRPAFGAEFAAEQGHTFAHTGHPEGFPFREGFFHIEADPVIFHRQFQMSIGGSERNVYMSRAGVLADVVKAFLDQTIGDDFDLLRQESHLRKLEADAAGMQALETIHELSQGRAEAELFEYGRTQSRNQTAHF